MTQLEAARKGKITPEMEQAAKYEGIAPEEILCRVAAGSVVIPKNHVARLCSPGDRHGAFDENQRQHRDIGKPRRPPRRTRQTARGDRGRGRCRHGPLHGGRHRRHPRRDDRPFLRHDRHGAHLPFHQPALCRRSDLRGSHRGIHLCRHRTRGPDGGRFHDRPLRHHRPGPCPFSRRATGSWGWSPAAGA